MRKLLNFIIQAIVTPLGIIEGVKALCKKQSSKGYKYAITSFVSFIFTVFVLAQDVFVKAHIEYRFNNIIESSVSYNLSISGASVVGVVLGAILLVASIILAQLKKGKGFYSAKNLKKFWDNNNIHFYNGNCEVLICGSGDGRLSGTGLMRESTEVLNQRFLIHILPKPGKIGD